MGRQSDLLQEVKHCVSILNDPFNGTEEKDKWRGHMVLLVDRLGRYNHYLRRHGHGTRDRAIYHNLNCNQLAGYMCGRVARNPCRNCQVPSQEGGCPMITRKEWEGGTMNYARRRGDGIRN